MVAGEAGFIEKNVVNFLLVLGGYAVFFLLPGADFSLFFPPLPTPRRRRRRLASRGGPVQRRMRRCAP